MAIVNSTFSGVFRLLTVNASDFIMYGIQPDAFSQFAFCNATTVLGRTNILSIIETLYLAAGGTIVSSSASYDAINQSLTVSVIATGVNSTSPGFPFAFTADLPSGTTGILSTTECTECPECGEPTTCDTCKQVMLKACQASYTLTTGLTPATTYTVALHAGNGNTYTQEVTTDGSGNITIDAAAEDFPGGFWVPESGGYVLKVYPNNDLDTPEDLTIDAVVYTCIQLNFTYVTTTT